MEQSIVIDTPEGIAMYRMLCLKQGLKMEIFGMKNSRVSAFSIIKKEFGLKGDKKKVLEQFEALIESKMPKPTVA